MSEATGQMEPSVRPTISTEPTELLVTIISYVYFVRPTFVPGKASELKEQFLLKRLDIVTDVLYRTHHVSPSWTKPVDADGNSPWDEIELFNRTFPNGPV